MVKTKPLEFIKMHGLGNDFVVFDGRGTPISLNEEEARAIADRRTGIGCDQLITISNSDKADVYMNIQNHDGSPAEACGNATRCIGAFIMDETGLYKASIETGVDILKCEKSAEGIRADIGKPHFGWQEIPLSEERDTLNVGLNVGTLQNPVAVNMGNPHVVYFVDKADEIDLAELGPMVETYPLFPERVNVSVVEVLSKNNIKLRVWERGAGITRACGTGAAASVVAAVRRGLVERNCKVDLLGGSLNILWGEDDHVFISGDATTSYRGKVDVATLNRVGQNNV